MLPSAPVHPAPPLPTPASLQAVDDALKVRTQKLSEVRGRHAALRVRLPAWPAAWLPAHVFSCLRACVPGRLPANAPAPPSDPAAVTICNNMHAHMPMSPQHASARAHMRAVQCRARMHGACTHVHVAPPHAACLQLDHRLEDLVNARFRHYMWKKGHSVRGVC